MEQLENVDEFLNEIENKYSLNKKPQEDFQQQLYILSQEFESLGLPQIYLTQPISELFQSVVNNTFSLIQTHRKVLSQITDLNVSYKSKDVKTADLQKNILILTKKLKTAEDQNINLENKLCKLNSTNEELTKKISMHARETDQLKQYFKSKQNQLIHHIKHLENETHHLKEICGKDFDKYFSKEDKFLKVLQTYKHKEEVYKEALQKLEDNNTEIMNEILNLKSELALAYLKKE